MLRLSREADYGLLAMMYIASQPTGRLAYRRDIAAHYTIPKEFLAKVLQKLARRGLIRSFRGIQGGYVLARDSGEITLADVVEAVDGPMALVDCQCEPHECRQEESCTVQLTMMHVRREIHAILARISIEDMRSRLRAEDQDRLIALDAGSR